MRSLDLLTVGVASIFLTVILSSSLILADELDNSRSGWKSISNEVQAIDAEKTSSEVVNTVKPAATPTNKLGIKLTSTLIAWISSQSEAIVEEMEAIVKQNAESSKFSLVNYLRYLSLYDSLNVIASKPIDEFKWVSRKAKIFSKIYSSVMDIVFNYLVDIDAKLTHIEWNEPKSKQTEVSESWVNLYEIINYIATHAPARSDLAMIATEMLQWSPNSTSDKKRSTRYRLKTNAFSR